MNVNTSSQRINPGENLGKRERVTSVYNNHRHNDLDLDPYAETRPYNPYEQGTYWGKFSAMYPNIQGYPFRVVRGNTDDPDLETSHYVADSGKIAGDKTGYTIVAKDVLDFAEGNKTLCPAPSSGLLGSAISAGDSSVTLTPTGIGDEEYPASFDASIGDESVICTRTGDAVTFVTRGAYFSTAVEHDEGDTLQIMESFVSVNASEILERLLGYTQTPAAYYNQSQWDQQVAIVNSPNLTARVAEPTEVYKLIQELMVDMALDIRTDIVNKKVIMTFLINQTPTMVITDDVMVGTPNAKFYEDKRVDLFFMSFGRRSPLEKMDEAKNYPATVVRPTTDPVSLLMGNPAAIRRHYSRWIPSTLRAQASQTAAFIVGRYGRAPRGLSGSIKATMAPALGQIVSTTVSLFEDEYGATPTIPMQVVSLSKDLGNYSIELEEFRAAEFDPNQQTIIVSLTEPALNMGGFDTMRGLYNSIYPFAIPADSIIRFEADLGVVFGSASTDDTSGFSIYLGDWPEVASDNVTIQIVGLIIAGKGGKGGVPIGLPGPSNGGDGGPALYTRVDVELIDCTVGGGGGGGGGARKESILGEDYVAFGGGGAGYVGGAGHVVGTVTSGGAGENDSGQAIGGSGGNLGSSGFPGSQPGTSGGDPGVAIDGDSYVTRSGTTTVSGPVVN
jgi:hypothetical protein